jgi:mannan polymerase II complex MNN10 subunit
MSLSRSPSPQPGGGWASPGLSSPFGEGSGSTTPRTAYRAQGDVTWESAKAKSEGINGYPSFSTHNNGFFNRHYRKISSSLPRFNLASDKSYAEKEKLGRGRWSTRGANRLARLRSLVRRASRKTKIRFLIGMALFALFILYYMTRKATFSNLRGPANVV